MRNLRRGETTKKEAIVNTATTTGALNKPTRTSRELSWADRLWNTIMVVWACFMVGAMAYAGIKIYHIVQLPKPPCPEVGVREPALGSSLGWPDLRSNARGAGRKNRVDHKARDS